MKKIFISAFLAAGILLGSAGTMVFAEAEELKTEEIRQELLQANGPVFEFLQKASQDMGEKLQAAIADGSLNPQNQDDVKAAMAKHSKEIFSQAVELRKTLKEPEHRMALDMEMLTLGSQSGLVPEVVAIINNWKGDVREAMIITAAQRFQMMKVKFTPEFDLLLKELAGSKDPQVVAMGERMLNEFFRDPVGKDFPAFPEGMKTVDGKDLSLARFKDKILLVDFWATWCPPCVAEVEPLVKVYNKYKDKGFEIVGISFDQDKAAFEKFVKEHNVAWPNYFDGKGWENLVGPTYGIQSIPAMFLLDKSGKIISTDLRDGKLEKELEKLIK